MTCGGADLALCRAVKRSCKPGCIWGIAERPACSLPSDAHEAASDERTRRLIAHCDRSSWAAVAWGWLAEARILASTLARQTKHFGHAL